MQAIKMDRGSTLQGKSNFIYYHDFSHLTYLFTTLFCYLRITRDWLDSISAYINNFQLTIAYSFSTKQIHLLDLVSYYEKVMS